MTAAGGPDPRVLVASEAGLRVARRADVMDLIGAYDADGVILTADAWLAS